MKGEHAGRDAKRALLVCRGAGGQLSAQDEQQWPEKPHCCLRWWWPADCKCRLRAIRKGPRVIDHPWAGADVQLCPVCCAENGGSYSECFFSCSPRPVRAFLIRTRSEKGGGGGDTTHPLVSKLNVVVDVSEKKTEDCSLRLIAIDSAFFSRRSIPRYYM